MICTIIKIQKRKSRYGGHFYYAFFKDDKGKSFYTCLYPKMRNFARWNKILKVGVTLAGLHTVKNKTKLIDADSRFMKVD